MTNVCSFCNCDCRGKKILVVAHLGEESALFQLAELFERAHRAKEERKDVVEVELQIFSNFIDFSLTTPAFISKNRVYHWQSNRPRDSRFKKQKFFYKGQFLCKKIVAPMRT